MCVDDDQDGEDDDDDGEDDEDDVCARRVALGVCRWAHPANQEARLSLLVESQHSSQLLITTSARTLCGGPVAKATSLSSKMFGSSPKALMTG